MSPQDREERKEWVKKTVLSGFALLKRLSLYEKPRNEDEADVVEVWVMALIASGEVAHQEVDAPRVMKAFSNLLGSRTLKRWPLPAHLLELLPERPRARTVQGGGGPLMLPLTPQEVIEGRRKWQELMVKVCGPDAVRSHAEERRREAAHQRERLR